MNFVFALKHEQEIWDQVGTIADWCWEALDRYNAKGLPRWLITTSYFAMPSFTKNIVIVLQSKADAVLLQLAWGEYLIKVSRATYNPSDILKVQRHYFLYEKVMPEIQNFVDLG
jgi:hypothetical protein